jgi:hypothetical protein
MHFAVSTQALLECGIGAGGRFAALFAPDWRHSLLSPDRRLRANGVCWYSDNLGRFMNGQLLPNVFDKQLIIGARIQQLWRGLAVVA